MCYAATHPEKLDAQKQSQWQKLARLREGDMATIINLEFLGVPVRKRGKGPTGLVFGRKRKRAVRKVNLTHCLWIAAVVLEPYWLENFHGHKHHVTENRLFAIPTSFL